MEQEGKFRNEVETVRLSTDLGDRVNVGGGRCEAAVTVGTRCGYNRECDKVLERQWSRKESSVTKWKQ